MTGKLKCGDLCIDKDDIDKEDPLKFIFVAKTPDGMTITSKNGFISDMDIQEIRKGYYPTYVWKSVKFVKYTPKVEESPIVELTLSEIADKIGIEVKNLRIKK